LKHAVQVTILGQQYTVKSAVAPEEVRRIADFVNEKVAEVMAASRAVDTLNTAVLALLSVGEAYLRLRDAGLAQEEELTSRLQKLLARLEQACPESPPCES
jgi:cell division protein ZapA